MNKYIKTASLSKNSSSDLSEVGVGGSRKTPMESSGLLSEEGVPAKIIVFACNWCSPISMDFESLKIEGQEVPIIRLMCSGRFHPSFALKAFELRADGVLILGCQDNECHYCFGNKKAKEQFEITQNLLHLLGIDGNRIKFVSIPKDEKVFEEAINKFLKTL